MDNLLIINADDFGYSRAINQGIIDTYRNGVLRSATIMSNMPGFEDAVRLAKQFPNLGVGVHLTLTCYKPVNDTVKTLVKEDGFFHNLNFYEKPFAIDLEELYVEWKTQIERVIKSGLKPDHIDSHHHVNGIEPMTQVFEHLAQEYDLPVRHNYIVSKSLKTTKRFFLEMDSLGTNKALWNPMIINNLVADVQQFKTVEAMVHPGYLDSLVFEYSSLTVNRTYMARELQNPVYQKLFKEKDITLGTFRDI